MTDAHGCLGQCREEGRFMTDVHGCLGQCREAGRFMTDAHGYDYLSAIHPLFR